MPAISFDGQSLLIDNRRVWLVSGSIHYARTPRELWPQRIRAAKQAGLNCVCTYVFWNLHEPEPGRFNFRGDADLRHFVSLVGREGMYCILRPGPYICAEWDFGGLPPWLLRIPEIKLRQYNEPYLEACSRYLGAVLTQVRDLQVTSPVRPNLPGSPSGGGGPIVMMQAENEWCCHNPFEQTKHPSTYLREIVRYLRENGCEVPINVCNNLWQRVEGAIDTWNANSHLAPDLRQLHWVQPNVPRIVTEFWPGWFDWWGGEHDRRNTPDLVEYRLASILAVGAQYNLYMFHGGTNFGFFGGRSVANPACFMTTSYDYDAPLLEAGGRGPKYAAVKRISTFASHFDHVLANLDPSVHPTVIAPTEDSHPLSVLHQSGSQGDVVFLLKSGDSNLRQAQVLLPNGLTLPVPLGDSRVAWLLLNAKLPGGAELTYTNLRPWAMIKKTLVLYGPAGAEGLVAVNGAPLAVQVPTGDQPLIQQHEGLQLVVLSQRQVDAAYPLADRLIVGADGLDEQGRPVPHRDWPKIITISQDGQAVQAATKPAKRRLAPRLGGWEFAHVDEYVDGSAPQYQRIAGPASLEALNCNFGYGWYRLDLPAAATAAKVMAPQAADRMHVYQDGTLVAILGRAPGAIDEPTPLKLKGRTVLLADNLGRFNYGWHTGEAKGLYGHLYAVSPMRLGKPKVTAGRSPDPFVLREYWTNLRAGESHLADTLSWELRPQGRNPLILELAGFPRTCMIFVNDLPIGMYDNNQSAGLARFLLEVGTHLRAGKNQLKLALFVKYRTPVDTSRFVKVYRTTANITEKAQWAFCRWELPNPERFGPLPRSSPSQPRWFRGTFRVNGTPMPLWLEPAGMSKGQIYLNGHDVGRYFVATAAGKKVPPQQRYYLPEPWINADAPNELLIFDEHGRHPVACRLVYDAMGPYG